MTMKVETMKRFLRHKYRLDTAHKSLGKFALALTTFLAVSVVPTLALAQSDTEASKPRPAIALNTESTASSFVGLSPSLSGAMIELPADAIGSGLFKLDLSRQDCLSGSASCVRRDETLGLAYNKPFKGISVKGLDLQLTPKASVSFDDETSSAVVGALVRIGDDLREGSDLKANTWYFFAGADAEAVTYSPNSLSRMTSGNFHLQDRIIVGDAQAGIGYRIGDADLSLGYFRREVSSFSSHDPADDFTLSENAAALSFTWRR